MVDENAHLRHLGKAFYLPTQNLLGEDLEQERTIFKNIPDGKIFIH
jgi:hypothetical protein